MTDHQDERFIREFYKMPKPVPKKHSLLWDIAAVTFLFGLALWVAWQALN